jgi:hypothetical protein
VIPVRLQKLDCVISAAGELEPLLAKARALKSLAGLVQRFLPSELGRELRVANFKDSELLLIAANSAAAAKLKLVAPALCRFLVERRWQVSSVAVRVQPTMPRGSEPRQKTVHFSTAALESLRCLYAAMSASPARDALARLLQRYDEKKRL